MWKQHECTRQAKKGWVSDPSQRALQLSWGGVAEGTCGKHPGLNNSIAFMVHKCIDICPNPSPLLTERTAQPTMWFGHTSQLPSLWSGNTRISYPNGLWAEVMCGLSKWKLLRKWACLLHALPHFDSWLETTTQSQGRVEPRDGKSSGSWVML